MQFCWVRKFFILPDISCIKFSKLCYDNREGIEYRIENVFHEKSNQTDVTLSKISMILGADVD